ncbi:MAG: PhzF family phenazine biosynthesis protein [Bdellovibrionales bacterium]|nr:PhzF family phenazine biosynthesis protein [Bdellovibrionales bacterium]
MKLPIYQVDAFTSKLFSGNPAAVCPLPSWLPDETLQKIAAENNLSETAFFVPDENPTTLRWFTPKAEVDLCGHATLATGFVYFNILFPTKTEVRFASASGELVVRKPDELLALDFPCQPAVPWAPACDLAAILGTAPIEILRTESYALVRVASEQQILGLKPDFKALADLDVIGCIVTAPGSSCDFVSRFFAPRVGIDEDPVTGSAHCTLVPYWEEKLGKSEFHARQLSPRGGELFCTREGSRVIIRGQAVLYLEGSITLEDLA